MLKPKELADLKMLAKNAVEEGNERNLDAVLIAAARLGASRSADAAKTIKRAVDILENDAESIKEAYDGSWTAEEKQDYDERKRIAKALRGLIEVKL